MKKILTLGNGFVANHLEYKKYTNKLSNNVDEIRKLLESEKPDCIVNCIGYCGKPNVDDCENNKDKTFLTNVTLPSLIASECEKLGIHFVHIGSGCIFFGESPNKEKAKLFSKPIDTGWKETNHANPLSYYSKTKYSCDLILGELSNVTILRIRMPISSKNDPRNFINKVKNYSKIIDIPNSITIMDDLACCIDWVIKNNKMGIYHVTNPQPISAAMVMKEYQRYNKSHKFEIISEAQLDKLTVAKRSNCILNTEKLNKNGFFMTPTNEALFDLMRKYIKNI